MTRPEWTRDTIYINGSWVEPGGAAQDVEDPADENVIGSVRCASASDVARAVSAAQRATTEWGDTAPSQRRKLLVDLAEALRNRRELIVDTLVTEVGTPLDLAESSQFGQALAVLDSYAEILQTYEFESQVGNSQVVCEPAGVVAAITPWNYPLYQLVNKVAPAIAAGCTVVAKPAELTPLNAFLFADAADEVGLPAGVFNIVPGAGQDVGAQLVSHPGVNVVSFTGSSAVGATVASTAGQDIKRTCLELGGKSASVVLPDANLSQAVRATVANVMVNSGQTCTAWTRLLVPAATYENALAIAKQAAEGHHVGHPRAAGTDIGPLISRLQRESVLSYVSGALDEGARLVAGGLDQPPGLERGYYVSPTILAGLTPQSRIAQEEVFGPVLVILPYTDVEDAIEIANGTHYGLAGAVWASDQTAALRVAGKLQAGRVDINGASWNPYAPTGGYRKSGIGRELGTWGMEEFMEVKSIQLPTAGIP